MFSDHGNTMSMDITSSCSSHTHSSNSASHTTSMSHVSEKHPRRILDALNILRKRQELWDVAIIVGSTKLCAHRVVLAAASPYFHVSYYDC